MAEVFVRFITPVMTQDGTVYQAQACGAPTVDGTWEGWIEFVPLNAAHPLRTPRETTQPNRTATAYWATGLTPVYLEGALDRALHPLMREPGESAESMFEGPAPSIVSPPVHAMPAAPEPILDPFAVLEKGETLLRKELGALAPRHLVNIIVAYELSSEPALVLSRLSPGSLIEIIVAAVRAQLQTR